MSMRTPTLPVVTNAADGDATAEMIAVGVAHLAQAYLALDAVIEESVGASANPVLQSILTRLVIHTDDALFESLRVADGDPVAARRTLAAISHLTTKPVTSGTLRRSGYRSGEMIGLLVAEHLPLDHAWEASTIPMSATMRSAIHLAHRDGDREPLAQIMAASVVWPCRITGMDGTTTADHDCMISFVAGQHGLRLFSSFGPQETGGLMRFGPVPPDCAWRLCVATCVNSPAMAFSTPPPDDAPANSGWWALLRSALSVPQGTDAEKTLLLTPLMSWTAMGSAQAQEALRKALEMGSLSLEGV
jgi:hypothetical protein